MGVNLCIGLQGVDFSSKVSTFYSRATGNIHWTPSSEFQFNDGYFKLESPIRFTTMLQWQSKLGDVENRVIMCR